MMFNMQNKDFLIAQKGRLGEGQNIRNMGPKVVGDVPSYSCQGEMV